ncbi:MAG: hypothetical protein AMXMBFR58_29680 [Phycisphaerae bacterium]
MNKEVRVTMKADDQVSRPAAAASRSLVAMADTARRSVAGSVAGVEPLVRQFTMLKTAAVGLVGGYATIASIRGVLNSVGQSAKEMEAISKSAGRLGLSNEDASAMSYVAEQVNVSYETLASGLAKLNRGIGDFARTGKSEAVDTLKALGISAKDASGNLRSAADLLPDISAAISSLKDPALRESVLVDLFGKSGGELTNLFAEGPQKIREIRTEAEKLNLVFGDQQAAVSEDYADSLDRVAGAWKALKRSLMMEVAPQLTSVMNQLATAVAAAPDIIRDAFNNIVNLIRGTASPEVAAAFDQLFRDLGDAVRIGIKGLASVGMASLIDGVDALIRYGPTISAHLLGAIGTVLASVTGGISKTISDWFSSMSDGIVNAASSRLRELRSRINALPSEIQHLEALVDNYTGYDPAGLADLQQQLSSARAELKNAQAAMAEGLSWTDQLALNASTAIGGYAKAVTDQAEVFAEKMKVVGAILDDDTKHKKLQESWVADSLAVKQAKDAYAELEPYLTRMGVSLDRILNLRANLAKHRVGVAGDSYSGVVLPGGAIVPWEMYQGQVPASEADLRRRLMAPAGSGTAGGGRSRPDPSDWTGGVHEGLQQIIDDSRNLHEQGRNMVVGLSNVMTSSLGSAVGQLAGGFKNLKEAAQDWLSNTLMGVSNLITQMLALRAIGGLFSAMAPTYSLGYDPASTVGAPFGDVIVNKGGRVLPSGAIAFARGGVVPGPDINRDIVPALLTPGEGVLNRMAMRANGSAVMQHMNRGGRVAPVGSSSGGGIAVSVTVNVQGGGGPDAATIDRLRRATSDGVLDGLLKALRTSPAGRESLRRELA